MAIDNKDKRGRQDRERIDAHERYEVEYEARKLGVSPEQVREAIKKVGNSRSAIEQELKSSRHASPSSTTSMGSATNAPRNTPSTGPGSNGTSSSNLGRTAGSGSDTTRRAS